MPDQLSFSDAEQDAKRKKTRREVFLDEMDQVVPWAALEAVIEPFYPRAGKGRHPYPLLTMLRIHMMQQWYALSDPALEEALYEISSMRRFARLSLARRTIPDGIGAPKQGLVTGEGHGYSGRAAQQQPPTRIERG